MLQDVEGCGRCPGCVAGAAPPPPLGRVLCPCCPAPRRGDCRAATPPWCCAPGARKRHKTRCFVQSAPQAPRTVRSAALRHKTGRFVQFSLGVCCRWRAAGRHFSPLRRARLWRRGTRPLRGTPRRPTRPWGALAAAPPPGGTCGAALTADRVAQVPPQTRGTFRAKAGARHDHSTPGRGLMRSSAARRIHAPGLAGSLGAAPAA